MKHLLTENLTSPVFQQLFAVSMKARTVDLPQLPIVAGQQNSVFAERLNVVVPALESLVSVERKLSYAFLNFYQLELLFKQRFYCDAVRCAQFSPNLMYP